MSDKYVLGFAFFGERVLLIEKARPPWQKGRLNGLGGKVETTESSLGAMCREFAEEAGVSISPHRWRDVLSMWNVGHSHVDVFACELTEEEVASLKGGSEGECLKLAPWKLLYQEPVLPNLLWLVPFCLDPDLDPDSTPTVWCRDKQ